MATSTLTAAQVRRIKATTLRRVMPIPAGLSPISGCDAYEPAGAGFRSCGTKPTVFAFFPFSSRTMLSGIIYDESALGAFCAKHTGNRMINVRQAGDPVRRDVLVAHLEMKS